jgi:hypothetical protein
MIYVVAMSSSTYDDESRDWRYRTDSSRARWACVPLALHEMVHRSDVARAHLKTWMLWPHLSLSETMANLTRDLLRIARKWAVELDLANSFDEVVECVTQTHPPPPNALPCRDYLYEHEIFLALFAEHLYRGQFNAVCRKRASEPFIILPKD